MHGVCVLHSEVAFAVNQSGLKKETWALLGSRYRFIDSFASRYYLRDKTKRRNNMNVATKTWNFFRLLPSALLNSS